MYAEVRMHGDIACPIGLTLSSHALIEKFWISKPLQRVQGRRGSAWKPMSWMPREAKVARHVSGGAREDPGLWPRTARMASRGSLPSRTSSTSVVSCAVCRSGRRRPRARAADELRRILEGRFGAARFTDDEFAGQTRLAHRKVGTFESLTHDADRNVP